MSLREALDYLTQFLVTATCLKILELPSWVSTVVVSIHVCGLLVILLFENEE